MRHASADTALALKHNYIDGVGAVNPGPGSCSFPWGCLAPERRHGVLRLPARPEAMQPSATAGQCCSGPGAADGGTADDDTVEEVMMDGGG